MSTLLHLDLKQTTIATAELRVFTSNPNVYESRSLNLSEVEDLVGVMERDYYVSALPENYGVTNMAGIYANQGQVELAIDLYQQSIAINEQIGNLQTKAAALAMMGQLLAHANLNVVQGLIYLKESREMFLHLKSPTAQVVQEIIERIES